MKNNKLDYIVLYLIVACFILTIAAVARLFALKEGFDGFSLFIIFVIAVVIQVIVYISIHSFMDRMLLPIIGKVLSKIPFINKIKAKRYASHVEGAIGVIQAPKRLQDEAEGIVVEEQTKSISDSQKPILEEIRQEQLQKRALEQEEQINTAVEYTRKTFVLYTSEEDLEVLILNLHIYINNLDMKDLKPINVKELTINDLRHFGWNIWNHFKPRKQEDIAYFLKVVFSDIFKEAEVESIKRHLKDDEKKGITRKSMCL
ncbi:hypothetical protein [Proteiniphilum saccharofermentans]|uniref:hypothetical protein n=1 Tax=Proteiniphilum saccharofermentans TaxID=1642647 RepID=UPI0028AB766D|nr:hypothetical protein [Proteiniphilum saccharofermentans]